MLQLIIILICIVLFIAWCCRDFNYTPAFVVKTKNHVKRVQNWKTRRKLLKRNIAKINKYKREVKTMIATLEKVRAL